MPKRSTAHRGFVAIEDRDGSGMSTPNVELEVHQAFERTQPASPSSMCRTTTTSLSCETDQSDVQLALTHVDDHHFGSVANPLFTIYWCHWYKTLAEKEPQLFSHYGSFDQPALQSLNDCKFCCFGLPTKILGIWGLVIY